MKILVLMLVLCLGHVVQTYSEVESLNRSLATCPAKSVSDSTGKYCCPDSCGQCGGQGCNTRPGGESSCCTSKITASCNTSGLPCIASTTPTNTGSCPAGGILNGAGTVCCAKSCGTCGGTGCHTRPGGASACCTSQVTSSCKNGYLPCVVSSSNPTTPAPSGSCPTGGIPDSTGKACCPSSCGTCGGSGCDARPGGSSNCCTSKFTTSCNVQGPPCLIGTAPSPTPPVTVPPSGPCPTGGIPDASGTACCPSSCGTCGGSGCDKRPGGPSNCCSSKFTASCTGRGPPCLIETTPPAKDYCADGIIGVLGPNMADFSNACTITVCCPKSCGVCGTSNSCSINDPCCAKYTGVQLHASARKSDATLSCRSKEPPCIVPYEPDVCAKNPCKNGGVCGVDYGILIGGQCYLQQTCQCAEGYAGALCEIQCGEGNAPCGESIPRYNYSPITPNNVCCGSDEICEKIIALESVISSSCIPKV